MANDSIVEEIREVRESLSKRFNHDLRAIAGYMQEQANKSGKTLVTLPPRKISPSESLSTRHDSTVLRSAETQLDSAR